MQHPTTPGGENEAVFTSFLFFGLFLGLAWAGGCFKMKHEDLPASLMQGSLIVSSLIRHPWSLASQPRSVKMTLSFLQVIEKRSKPLSPE